MTHHDPREQAARAWIRILRDAAILLCAVFLFLYGALTVEDPTLLTIFFGAGLTLLGIPPYLRREQWGQNGNGNGNGRDRDRGS